MGYRLSPTTMASAILLPPPYTGSYTIGPDDLSGEGGGGTSTVLFDAVGPSSAGQGAGATTSITWSHTCSGNNRYVIVGCSNSSDASTTTATFGGVSMTSLGKIHSNNSTSGYTQLFGLVNPPTGASTVVVTSSVSASLTGGSISFSEADQTTPVGTAASG